MFKVEVVPYAFVFDSLMCGIIYAFSSFHCCEIAEIVNLIIWIEINDDRQRRWGKFYEADLF